MSGKKDKKQFYDRLTMLRQEISLIRDTMKKEKEDLDRSSILVNEVSQIMEEIELENKSQNILN
jgi:hypothetical protein